LKKLITIFLTLSLIISITACKDQKKTLYSEQQLIAMVNEICSPSFSSNPYDYIKAHQEAFDKIISNGNQTVDIFVIILKKSKVFGLDKYIMAEACTQITGIGKDKNTPWSTANEWLAIYLKAKK
jgi:hypothetical protein